VLASDSEPPEQNQLDRLEEVVEEPPSLLGVHGVVEERGHLLGAHEVSTMRKRCVIANFSSLCIMQSCVNHC